ncbi:EF-hand domain-containing protein [Streptomyces uncialis]|uniref:EF-hand domain-containing protein n=1 Tax=Streptomyces uncialis TaxID=1048205 RepID=UPI00386BF4AC|nr:EF-hand domain-containing protein [Streptomyces uncialis]WST72493.1 EF-hand domain-containing protein [Streptomyces uncialis]
MATAAPDIITTKLERSFAALDTDHDGHLDRQDYQRLADRYLDVYHLGPDDRRARALHAFLQTYWLELLRHADVQEDRLSRDEYVAAVRLASADTSRLNLADGLGHVLFDVIDANSDNQIAREEFTRFLTDVWNLEEADALKAFRTLDTDGDDTVSRPEFLQAIRGYFLLSDPDAPGSLFFGTP